MSKRILIFSLAYYPKHVGGAEIAIKEITDRIDPSQIEFHMVTNRFDSTLPAFEKCGNVFVHRIGFSLANTDISKTHSSFFYVVKILYVPFAAWKAWRLHRRHPFDGLWAMMAYMTFPIVLLKMFGVSVPYALTLQEGDPFEHVFKRWYIRVFRPLLIWGFKGAVVVQAISSFLGRWAQQMGFQGTVEIIPNAVNTKYFSQVYTPEEVSTLRQTWSPDAKNIYLITTSRLVNKNAVDDVISALAYLPPAIHFLVLGVGPDLEALQELARDKAVVGRVHFLGQVGHVDLPRYLKAAHIFVRPSRSEGMGNSFVEAMAAGLPVIATQEGGIADFLFDENRNPDKDTTGWVVDKNSPEQIVAAVQDILAHPEKVKKVTETARAMVIEKYDWDLIAQNMKARVFERLWRD